MDGETEVGGGGFETGRMVERCEGTTVGGVEGSDGGAEEVKEGGGGGGDRVVVLSVMGGETSGLIDLAEQIGGDQQQVPRELDVIVS
ncbi:hypothetical protein B1218_37275, partial [Pseudomonas ogarae]